MESTNRGRGERHLAERLRRALNDGKLSSEHVGATEQKVEYNRAVHQVAALQVDEAIPATHCFQRPIRGALVKEHTVGAHTSLCTVKGYKGD